MVTKSILIFIILGLSVITIIALGAIVLTRNPRHRLHQTFFGLTCTAALWAFTNLIYGVAVQPEIRLSAALISYASAAALVLFFMHYCAETVRAKLRSPYLVMSYCVAATMTLLTLIPGYLANSVAPDGRIMTNMLPLILYTVHIVVYISIGLLYLLIGRARAKNIHERSTITIVLIGLVLASLVGVVCNLILPFFGDYDYFNIGPISTLLLVTSSTYAIVRHRLFDIKLAVVRTTAYIGVLSTLAGAYYLIGYIVSLFFIGGASQNTINLNPVNIIVMLALVLLFQPVKRFFDLITNNIFYHQGYNSEEFFAKLSTLLSSTIDLRGLLERASAQIASTFNAEQVFFFVQYTDDSDHYMSAGTKKHARLPIQDARLLDAYMVTNGPGIFLTDNVVDSVTVQTMLKSHKIALVMPLYYAEKIAGYVMLGENLSGNYAKHDLNVLSAISNELVIAIQNAVSLEELKDLNATLQQRIDVATTELRSSNAQLKHLDEVKDEFMSMASHQLRTPLTSVKGYLSMVLEGDVGKVSPQQRKLLLEAFNSSERMVRLIADFLNVSRLQTGKFLIEKAPVDIKSVIKQEMRDLELLATSHDIKLKLIITDKLLPLFADESKVRQVVMNFVDNAIYYSPAKSTIVVTVERVKDSMALTVVDCGIGVPQSEQSQLFTKFFRAKNARQQRPDGTGVGLYLARRVITAHSGAIIFSSREGKGSTFGFRLPLADDTLPAEPKK